ncbi:hypothetical protein CONPUDRAFT_86434 [Coniophora puteana RWD-64-598 SS2]|uniref:Uncharacterized protein n=1 Tax=Coniophora puteana (strain RWD-64-598) TaxID=741705 RepID=A0A5M3N5W2_CONPW|nr:uncharacterized protein CONPUDRAFT_86434 [Coniophora puteana RWD-64-598 SS2]EIW86464.1 hypothetical protein CONPUDRAFT_86434 [Coniophora puteana RWD-64-598 SS2]
MDELVHHCLRELSFDGDLGCDVSRLQEFITGFYNGASSGAQVIDDDFCAFVWSILLQNLTVRVGVVPPGVSSEVYIAPQNSTRRKAQSNGEEHVEASAPNLALIPDARLRPLGDLKVEFGDALRIAVDPETSFAAITGSHVRPSKLTPMVYSALQLITRGREEGISTVELGKKTSYDQKTCFYLIKQLQELDLVVKVRRGGVGNHCCIHRFFVERSSFWQQLRAEEASLEGISENKLAEGSEVTQEDGESDADEDQTPLTDLQFEAIDSRHLSSLILVRSRLVKLLKASKNNVHPSNNLLVAIGFANPTKTDRRFFQTRLRELITQGIVERVLIPNSKLQNRMVKCIRLLDANAAELPENNHQGDEIVAEENIDVKHTEFELPGVMCNRSLYKQIIDLIESSGSAGMTLHGICSTLGNFDKRTVELILARAFKSSFPSHLSDLGVADVMETFGRERRHRFYTVAAYRTLMESEQLNDSTSTYGSVDLSNAGGFAPVELESFYGDTTTLIRHQDTYQKSVSKSKKRKRVDNTFTKDDGPSASSSKPRKKSRIQEPHTPSEPTIEDVVQPQPTPKKRGRPRKNPEQAETAIEESHPKKRGRPPKELPSIASTSAASVGGTQGQLIEAPAPSPKEKAPEKPRRRSQRDRKDVENTSNPDVSETQHQHIQSPVTEARIPGERTPNAPSPVKDGSENLNMVPTNDVEAPSTVPPAVTDIAIDPALMQIPATGTTLDTIPPPPVDDALSIAKPTPVKGKHRARGGRATRVNMNISHLRRENELLRVIRESGGIVNLHTRNFWDAHLALLDTLYQEGEAASAPPGARLDKRTLDNAVKNMENSGSIKVLKTSIMAHTGVSRQTTVMYLPDLPQETINEYLLHISQNAPAYNIPQIRTYEEPIDFGRETSVAQRSALPLQLLQRDDPGDDPNEKWTRNIARAEQLFAYDAETVRQVLLTERTTVAQLYGYVVAKAIRTRDMHLLSVDLFSPEVSAANVVSKEHRIVHVSYYHQDIPLVQYCALVSVLADDMELKECLDKEGGLSAVQDYPQFDASLQPGRSRCRSRILDMLVTLHSLGIVTPLEPVDAADAEITCTSTTHPSTYKAASMHGWTANTPQTAPQYWKFATSAPIHLWALSDTLPPFWKIMPVSTREEVAAYWKELQEVCLNRDHAESIVCPGQAATGGRRPGIGAARTLRRKASWDRAYVLTWHQKQFMNNVFKSGSSASEVEDFAEQTCYVTGAPRQTVVDYLSNPKHAARRQDAKRKRKVQTAEEEAQRDAEGRQSLRDKAQQIKRQREKGWDDLLQRIHPEPIIESATVRLRAVRGRFLQSGSTKNAEKWEKEVKEALDEGAAVKVIAGPSRVRRFKPLNVTKPSRLDSLEGTISRAPFQSILPPPASNPPEKSVEQLVAQQGTPLEPQAHKKIRRKPKGKGKEKAREEDPEDTSKARRPKFHWTREYDELVRDASAIIRARCRVANRSDLSAYDQVFPAVPRNSVRQRVTHLRENPVDDSYQKRLEDRWYELWSRYRGTDILPDEDPFSPSNFELPNHIEFLRKHVDKNAIRIGFVERKHTVALPASVEETLKQYEIIEEEPTAPDWDFLWNAHIDEGREKVFSQQAFSARPNFSPQVITESEDIVAVAEAAVKMVFSTPNERYDSERASQLLYSAGEHAVSVAIPNLLRRGVLSKLVRDPKKPKPGRTFKISEINQNALGGTIAQDTFENAVALPDVLSEDGWADWPLVVEDGDVAGLLQLVSDDKVDFNFDLNQKHEARERLDFNSKKADDEDVEILTQVRLKPIPQEFPDALEPSPEVESEILEPVAIDGVDDDRHGKTRGGEEATCCRSSFYSLVDCSACVDENIAKLTSQMPSPEVTVTLQIAEVVREAGQHGIDREGLKVTSDDQDLSSSVVDKMVTAPFPLLFWAGYSTATLVSCDYLRAWTIITDDGLKTRAFPRRWLDIKGVKVTATWEAALRAVMGVVLFRPGISQFELRWRLRAVYDRQEIAEVMEHLKYGGFVEARPHTAEISTRDSLEVYGLKNLGDDDGRHVFWFVVSGKERFWYELV